jgi:uncharacterized protein
MKTLVTVLITLLFVYQLIGQDIKGQWNGVLKVQGIQLRIVFNITKTENAYSSTMDSPDQGAKGIPVTNTTLEGPNLKLEITSAGIEYTGELKGENIIGIFKQRGMEFPLDLSRDTIGNPKLNRPQNPTEPYPYYSEEITFQNSNAKLSLAGTLTLPDKNGVYPAVILITGSGPQNRDEEIMGHKPFLIISDFLTRNGFAVLRFDDRGVAKSTGDFKTATSVDFASDVKSAIAYLKTRKEINKKKIGLIGHSEGGIIAPMVAAGSKDVNFIVLLAGTGIRGDKLLLMQQALILKASGSTTEVIQKTKDINSKVFDLIIKSTDDKTLRSNLTGLISEELKNTPENEKPPEMKDDDYIEMQVNQIMSPWMLYFLRYDPSSTLEKVKCPVLALNGEKDLQVPADENLNAIEKALKKDGNKKVTIKKFSNLNHLFQECKTGNPAEYALIEQTISPDVLEEISKWIKLQVK